jgi:hypothetical protein
MSEVRHVRMTSKAHGTVKRQLRYWSVASDAMFPEVENIISVLQSGVRQDFVILFIPSHDKNDKSILGSSGRVGKVT